VTVDVTNCPTQAVVITGRTGLSLTAWEKALSDPTARSGCVRAVFLLLAGCCAERPKVPVGDPGFRGAEVRQAVAACPAEAGKQTAAAVASQNRTLRGFPRRTENPAGRNRRHGGWLTRFTPRMDLAGLRARYISSLAAVLPHRAADAT